ncbi:MAG TPA: hypothetical protein VI260_10500 [Blastocatellia bacterium]|jgi:hypothetical protein
MLRGLIQRNPGGQVAFVARAFAAEHDFGPWRVGPGLFDADPILRRISLLLLRSEVAEGFQPCRARPISSAKFVEEFGPPAPFDLPDLASLAAGFVRARLSGFRRLR